jgi:dihydropyrimidine dehydrogenase (NAD+) subunit PreT
VTKATTSRYELPRIRLENDLVPKHKAYDPGEALTEASRCLYCYDAPCTIACPTSIDVPAFIKGIASANVIGAAETILSANILGASCARVCPVEVLCEGSCVYVDWGRKPIEIGRLQRFATDNGADGVEFERQPDTGHSIGFVGAGPASLACAAKLALLGHTTVIYEKSELPGGLNTAGIAPYKMQAPTAIEEAEFVESLGVTIKTGVAVGVDITPEDLLSKHDVVFLGIGLGDDSNLDVPGGDAEGVVGAVDWIRRLKTDAAMSVNHVQSAVVIGGGNTALDAARELARLGVAETRLIYRRTVDRMPGYEHELYGAKYDGVTVVTDALVKAVIVLDGKVESVQLVRAEDGRPTEEDVGTIPVDLVVVATGQARLRDLADKFEGVEFDQRGHIVVDPETGQTGNPNVFAGGDACNGGKEVVNAVDEGQRAALAIHQKLTGTPGEES